MAERDFPNWKACAGACPGFRIQRCVQRKVFGYMRCDARVERGTSAKPCRETFARPHRVTKASLDDVGQGEACLQELPSGF